MDGIKKPLIGKERIDINDVRYKIKKNGDLYTAHKSKNTSKKALSLGLIGSMLWLYSEGNHLFGKNKNKEKETYETMQTIPSSRNIEYNLEKNIDPNRGNQVYSQNVKNIAKSFSLKENYKDNLEKKLEVPIPFFMDGQFGYLQNGKFTPASKDDYARWKEYQAKKKNEVKEEKKKGLSAGTIALIAGGVAAIGVIAYLLLKPKKKEIIIPDQKKDVKLNFEVYNHRTGKLAEYSVDTKSGDSVPISINDLKSKYGIDNIDEERLVVFSDNFSSKIIFAKDGDVSITAPNQNTNYDIVVFNALGKNSVGDQISYQWMDEQNASLWRNKSDWVVYRKDRDNVTGPEGSWKSVFDQLNNGMARGWKKWGSFTRKPAPNDGQGDFSYGYAICIDYRGWRVDGTHSGSTIYVDAERNDTEKSRRAVGLEEAFENVTETQNIGNNPSLMTIQSQGVLKQEGEDLLNYVIIIHNAPKESASASTQGNRITQLNRISSPGYIQRNPKSLPISKKIGKADIGAVLSEHGNRKSVIFQGAYDIGDGNIFFEKDLTDDYLLAGLNLGQDLNIAYNTSSKQVRFNGRVKPSKETSINLLVDNILHPKYVPVQFNINGKNIDALIAVNNALDINNISAQTNLTVNNFNAFLNYVCNTLGPDTASIGGAYNFSKDGRIGFSISGYNNNLSNIDLGIFLKALSLVYGRDNIGNNSVRLSISKQF